MTNDLQLIDLFCTICQYYNNTIVLAVQRQSNNFCPKFTDEECMTIYIWGIIQQKYEAKAAYDFIKNYYIGWFPNLPSYQAFNKRITYLADAFKTLADLLLGNIGIDPTSPDFLIDSMPVTVAGARRSQRAKVAPEVCNKGYCASKGAYFYGVKLHLLAQSRHHALPVPSALKLAAASESDLTVGKEMLENTHDINVFGDKIYRSAPWAAYMKQNNNVSVITPVKLKKGHTKLSFFDKCFSSAVSSIRQPIESFFNWLQVKTNIHQASKVRSVGGLISFIYARIVVACFFFNS